MSGKRSSKIIPSAQEVRATVFYNCIMNDGKHYVEISNNQKNVSRLLFDDLISIVENAEDSKGKFSGIIYSDDMERMIVGHLDERCKNIIGVKDIQQLRDEYKILFVSDEEKNFAKEGAKNARILHRAVDMDPSSVFHTEKSYHFVIVRKDLKGATSSTRGGSKTDFGAIMKLVQRQLVEKEIKLLADKKSSAQSLLASFTVDNSLDDEEALSRLVVCASKKINPEDVLHKDVNFQFLLRRYF